MPLPTRPGRTLHFRLPVTDEAGMASLRTEGILPLWRPQRRPHLPEQNNRPSAAGDLVREGRGIGAAAVLQARVVWRRVCRDPDAFAATMTALLASAALSTERAQTAVTHLFVTVAFRFVRPPAIRAATVPVPCSCVPADAFGPE